MSMNYATVVADGGAGGFGTIVYSTGNGSLTDLNRTRMGEEASVIDLKSLISIDYMDIGSSGANGHDIVQELTTAVQNMNTAIEDVYSKMESTTKEMQKLDTELSSRTKVEF